MLKGRRTGGLKYENYKTLNICLGYNYMHVLDLVFKRSESESELFTGDTSKDNHSPGPVFREVSP